ncbi:energy-coupling factor ABC transporter ATP-binding protein [Lapidilactobacillus luobeiensis]|uniref:energy-coupling factor ABC transporter ATP-binding protein n=1 Tax=Lapidilactobacillus luobeiensis TaxID=2950371 RepID=UPI0021C301C6|nr:energy-coupling factor ABC transporter ATP-binding protein [Lapidilactobacillus luobeiensis]
MEPLIRLEHLTYTYNNSSVPALNDVSLTIAAGQWIAIVGHNGSGKSTLAKTLNGLIEPQQGQVFFNGTLLDEDSVWAIRRKIGVVFQSPDNQFVGATVADDVAFGMENNGVPRAEMVPRVAAALAQVRMSEYAAHEPARLSGGQKQRVALAGVLAQQPEVIILDEATSMLDPQGRQDVVSLMTQLQAAGNFTIISITHDIDEAALADQVILMDDGRLIQQGPPATIFNEGALLRRHGLTVPLSEQVRTGLVKQGVPLSDQYLSEEQLVSELWTLHLNK